MLSLTASIRRIATAASSSANRSLICRDGAFAPVSALHDRRRAASSAAPSGIPSNARVVVVGGGIIGTSVAYHLGKAGWGNDVVLLERDAITSGTTWHAAGLMVTFGSTSETSTELRKYTKHLYSSLEEETGQSTGFMPVGFIELATNPDRLEEYRRVAAFNRLCGVDVQEIGPSEVQGLFPACRVDDVLAGFYVESDGRVNPVDATMALAKGARMGGVSVREGVTVTGIKKAGGRVTGVTTSQGDIDCDYVVNCAGMWARQFAEMAGVCVPNQAAEHYYLITDAMPEVDPSWPVVEDPSSYAYIRPEGGGLMVGLFEAVAAAWNVGEIPNDFSFGEITPDWERMGPYLEAAMSRVPSTMDAGMKTFFCGPESFTPDLAPVVGEAPELRNYFVAAGLNSIGILTGGGIGKVVADWIVDGKPSVDVTPMNIDRLHPYMMNPEYRSARVVESLGRVYKTHYPAYSVQTARGVKRSPIYDRLKARGAYFRDVSGWEGADWYAPEGQDPQALAERLCWGRHDWFPLWEAEHRACREGVVLIDMSFMSKFSVQGKDAGAALNYISTANVDDEEGVITYTQWLDDDGKMQADLTVAKLSEDKFFVVATDTAHRHVETWMSRHFEDSGAHAVVTDVTGGYAQFNLQGPNSRKLLAALTSCDVSDEAFPFRTAREIDIGFARVMCTRITYVGELGYELFVPAENALHVYDRIVEVGEAEHGLVHCGLKGLSSLRMEKAYRDYGHDMDNTDTLLEVGLGFTADFDKPGGFRGREAVLAQKEKGTPRQRLLQILVTDPEPCMFHAEVVHRNGVPLGEVRAASYGHTLGGAVGLAMIHPPEGEKATPKWIREGEWQVDIAGTLYPAKASLAPMYDPKNEKIKA